MIENTVKEPEFNELIRLLEEKGLEEAKQNLKMNEQKYQE